MASRGDGQARGRLDATGDREVVFCHACSNEWYRDEHGLICPQCEGDIIEIVSPENDPREPLEDPPSGPARPQQRQEDDDSDSDPGAADIEEYLQGAHGFHYHRNTRSGEQRQHHDPEMEPVLNRFLDMISGFGGGGRMPHVHGQNGNLDEAMAENASGAQNPGADQDHTQQPHQHQHHHIHQRQHTFATAHLGPRTTVHRVVSNIGGGGGTASFTIYTRTSNPRVGEDGMWGDQGFQQHFNSILGNMGPPRGGQQDRDSDANIGGGPPLAPGPGDFIASLQRMLALIDPANAAVGDAVYSQEALDRIISNLMEANTSSNAAPPATDEALAKLERKPVSRDMLANEPKTECSICIDDIVEGEMALFLPCKHWFHEKCVVMWLKEHNTCPICRTPIEERESRSGGSNDNAGRRPANTQSSNEPGSSGRAPEVGSSYMNWLGGSGGDSTSSHAGTPSGNVSRQSHLPSPSTRPPSRSQSRLNEAMRSISARQTAQRDRDRDAGSSSGVSFDTSSMQRRNSMSPTSSRAFPTSSSRIRQRSPSRGNGGWAAADEESESQSARSSGGAGGSGNSSGPLGWIRGRLGGSGSSRDARPSWEWVSLRARGETQTPTGPSSSQHTLFASTGAGAATAYTH